MLGRVDAARGVASWGEALEWLATYEPTRTIGEIQYWGHGRWGRILVGDEVLDAGSLSASHRHRSKLDAVRDRTCGEKTLVWLRTCEAFGAIAGHDFARRLADYFGARVAGHTFVIGGFQSGLHGLRPGMVPSWALDEGLADGTPEAPRRAHVSGPDRPNTITCFDGHVPDEWFAARPRHA